MADEPDPEMEMLVGMTDKQPFKVHLQTGLIEEILVVIQGMVIMVAPEAVEPVVLVRMKRVHKTMVLEVTVV